MLTRPLQKMVSINTNLLHPALSVLSLLNKLPQEYPDAISLSSGRPADEMCNPEMAMTGIQKYLDTVKANGTASTTKLMGQYGRTEGFINSHILQQLQTDEDIRSVEAKDIITTVGFQEAAALVIMTLFGDKKDVLLIPDPVFIGLPGIATLQGVNIKPIPCAVDFDLNQFKLILAETRAEGLHPKAVYVIPDFSNPQGTCMSLADRKELLAFAEAEKILIIEDNAYSLIRFEGEKIPSLKSLDTTRNVIYLGTYAKTMFPALRIGFVIADQDVKVSEHEIMPLTTAMINLKSMLTVNTPALTQAAAAGILIENNYSLQDLNKARIDFYRNNRDCMLKSLAQAFPADSQYNDISWNKPQGGFFITLALPFVFTHEDLVACAKDFKVIVFPTSLFSLQATPSNQVRLAFTNVDAKTIELGIERFANYVKKKLTLEAKITSTLPTNKSDTYSYLNYSLAGLIAGSFGLFMVAKIFTGNNPAQPAPQSTFIPKL